MLPSQVNAESANSFTAIEYAPTESANCFTFVEYTPKATAKRGASKRDVRAQAARASSAARLETIRKRSQARVGPLDQRVVPLSTEEPLPCNAVEQHRAVLARYRDREASVTVQASRILGGSIPAAQANVAILGRFFDRFNLGPTTERPWVQLVMVESDPSATSSLPSMAFLANATALYANDLQRPEMYIHATKQYLSTITRLRSELSSPRWRDSTVMYTCMILTFYECIQSNNPSARRAHVTAVAHLIQQKGPQSFAYGLQHKTFRYFRINLLMLALFNRQAIFLSETEWRTIPFSGDGPPKSMSDHLVDVLVEIPAVLAALDTLKNGELTRFTLIQKAFSLANWVRRLSYDLERWKENYLWAYPTICTAKDMQNLSLLAFCELATGLSPYDTKLGEALNCYSAAHLILARIARGMTERSFILRSAMHPPYSLRELVSAIILISQRHICADTSTMTSMMVTTFPLKVAQSTTELHEPILFNNLQELLDQINAFFARKYNINYSVLRNIREYEV